MPNLKQGVPVVKKAAVKKATPEIANLDLTSLRNTLLDLLKEKGYTVNSFSKSKEAMKMGLRNSNIVRVTLYGNSTSFDVLKKMCRGFNLGELKKERKVSIDIVYTLY